VLCLSPFLNRETQSAAIKFRNHYYSTKNKKKGRATIFWFFFLMKYKKSDYSRIISTVSKNGVSWNNRSVLNSSVWKCCGIYTVQNGMDFKKRVEIGTISFRDWTAPNAPNVWKENRMRTTTEAVGARLTRHLPESPAETRRDQLAAPQRWND
jgi:hypothetical protein